MLARYAQQAGITGEPLVAPFTVLGSLRGHGFEASKATFTKIRQAKVIASAVVVEGVATASTTDRERSVVNRIALQRSWALGAMALVSTVRATGPRPEKVAKQPRPAIISTVVEGRTDRCAAFPEALVPVDRDTFAHGVKLREGSLLAGHGCALARASRCIGLAARGVEQVAGLATANGELAVVAGLAPSLRVGLEPGRMLAVFARLGVARIGRVVEATLNATSQAQP